MGYDSTIKSERAERRQRLIIVVSLITIASVCLAIARLLNPDSENGVVSGGDQSQRLGGDRFAAAKSLADLRKSAAMNQEAAGHSPKLRSSTDGGNGGGGNGGIAKADAEKAVASRVSELDAEVRAIKSTGVIMEADEHSLEVTAKLQAVTRELIKLRYGDPGTKNYRVRLDLEFQSTIPDFKEKGKDGTLLFELAPISLIPCSVFNFLEIARTWKNGAFHRNAGHVLQAIARSDITKSMPFQEYSKEYPHKKFTVGYAGRPSGPEFYVSIQDNTQAHGPGSQQTHNPYEADCIIGKVIEGAEHVVPRIHTMPGKEFIGDKNKWVLIRRMHILVPSDDPGNVDGYVEFSMSPLTIPE